MNNGQPPAFYVQIATLTTTEISIASLELSKYMTWEVSDCSQGSDQVSQYNNRHY